MDEIEKQQAEIQELKKQQALHCQQLEENRKRALKKKKETKYFIFLGQIVSNLLPDISGKSEDEILELLKKKLSEKKPGA